MVGRDCKKECAQCGRVFIKDPRNTWAYWERAKYCSRVCSGLANSARLGALRPDMREKFEAQIEKTDTCWPWTGLKDKDGYGLFQYHKKQYRAHVKALEFDGRPVPRGMYGCHHCDNPGCVRPDHLYPGTPTQNMADAKARGRLNRPSKLTVEQVLSIRSALGKHAEIAAIFKVSRATVSLIRERKTWRHIP